MNKKLSLAASLLWTLSAVISVVSLGIELYKKAATIHTALLRVTNIGMSGLLAALFFDEYRRELALEAAAACEEDEEPFEDDWN